MKPRSNVFLICVLCLSALMITLAGCGDTGRNAIQNPGSIKSESETSTPPLEVDAEKLYNDYHDNKFAADKEYKDCLLKITGKIDEIGEIELYGPYVKVQSGEMIGSIWCVFEDSVIEKLATLKKGDNVTIQGICTNEVIANISMKECKIVD